MVLAQLMPAAVLMSADALAKPLQLRDEIIARHTVQIIVERHGHPPLGVVRAAFKVLCHQRHQAWVALGAFGQGLHPA
jgi:hypothetical protein